MRQCDMKWRTGSYYHKGNSKLCSMCDFSTIERGEKYVTIQHDETGLVVAYTSEERLNVKH